MEKQGVIAKSIRLLAVLALVCLLGGIFCFGTVLVTSGQLDYLFPLGWILFAGSILLATFDFILAFIMGVKLSVRDKVQLWVSIGLSSVPFLFLLVAIFSIWNRQKFEKYIREEPNGEYILEKTKIIGEEAEEDVNDVNE